MTDHLPLMERMCGGKIRIAHVLAEKLTVENGQLIDRHIADVWQPICPEDSKLMTAIMRVWRARDPKKVLPEDFVDATQFDSRETFLNYLQQHPERLSTNPAYQEASRGRHIRMCLWFDRCLPGHDRWEALKLARPSEKSHVTIKRKINSSTGIHNDT